MTSEGQLKNKSKSATVWVAGGHICSQVIRLGGNLVLTRLLYPEAFGLMAIVFIVIMGLQNLSDVGLQQNVIQTKKELDKKYLGTIWVIQIIRGVFISLCTALIALTLMSMNSFGVLSGDSVYANDVLPYLILTMAIVPLINGFESVNLLVFNRELKMKPVTVLYLTGQALGLLVIIALAWYTRSVWALVIGCLVAPIIMLVVSHHRYFGSFVRPVFDKVHALEIYHFGKWIFLSSIIAFALNNGDRLILGGLITPTQLGIYSIAFMLASAIRELASKLSFQVFYAVFAETNRNHPESLKSTYYSIRWKMDCVVMFMAGALFSFGDIIVRILYSPEYYEAGWMFEVLSLALIFVGFSLARVLLLATDDVRSSATLTLAVAVFLFVTLPVAFSIGGLSLAVYAVAFCYIIDIPLTFIKMRRKGLLDLRREFLGIPAFVVGYFIFSQIYPFFDQLIG